MKSKDRAAEIAAEIIEALDYSGVEDVHVTLDTLEIENALAAGQACIAVLAPKQSFPTFAHAENSWQIFATAGPLQDQLAAWDVLDDIIEALREPLDLETAEPDAYQQTERSPAYPAYLLTFTEII